VTRREEEIMVLTTVILGRWLWGYATAPWIAKALGFTPRRVRELLARLQADGEVERGHHTGYGYIWERAAQ
jgi:Mn-dependent DtxR family transcriptional regulator